MGYNVLCPMVENALNVGYWFVLLSKKQHFVLLWVLPKQSLWKPAKCAVTISAFEAEEFNFQHLLFEAKYHIWSYSWRWMIDMSLLYENGWKICYCSMKMDERYIIALCIHQFHCSHPQFIDFEIPLIKRCAWYITKWDPALKDPSWRQEHSIPNRLQK